MYMETYWVGLRLHFPLPEGVSLSGTELLCLLVALNIFSRGILLEMLAGLGVGSKKTQVCVLGGGN